MEELFIVEPFIVKKFSTNLNFFPLISTTKSVCIYENDVITHTIPLVALADNDTVDLTWSNDRLGIVSSAGHAILCTYKQGQFKDKNNRAGETHFLGHLLQVRNHHHKQRLKAYQIHPT